MKWVAFDVGFSISKKDLVGLEGNGLNIHFKELCRFRFNVDRKSESNNLRTIFDFECWPISICNGTVSSTIKVLLQVDCFNHDLLIFYSRLKNSS